MQDAKEANQYGGPKFDGSKVNTSTAVPVGSGKAAPDYKKLNQDKRDQDKAYAHGLHLDKPAKPIPSVTTTKAAPAPKPAKAAPAKAAAATKPPPKK